MPPPTFWCHPDAPEPLCAETLDWLEPDELIVYSRYRSPEGVAMCKYLLGYVWVDPRQSQNNGMAHLYRRFPAVVRFREFRRSSAEAREREVDAGEALTLRVRESLASTTLITLVHTWYGLPYLLVPFRRSGAPLRPNPSPAREKSEFLRLHPIPEPEGGSNVQIFAWLC